MRNGRGSGVALLISLLVSFSLSLSLWRCATPPSPTPRTLPAPKPTPAVVAPEPAPTPVPIPAAPVAPTSAPLFSSLPEPRLDVSLATDRPSVSLSAIDWILERNGRAQRRRGPLTFASRGSSGVPLFIVQAGSFSAREKAEAERGRIASLLGIESKVAENGGRFAVRIGPQAERKEAETILALVRREAVPEAFLVGAAPASPSTILMTDATGTVELASPVELIPADGPAFPFAESLYRGHLLIRATGRGSLHAINRVNLEDYLKGVVPGEMGPRVFDELEALKAQTVAARSYALRRRGDFAAEGYDLCATPRCQVYGGMSVEQPLSTAAVEATAGEVLLFQGRVADTLFTSTCGGRTEDVADVFPSYSMQETPYLSSVVCFAESQSTLVSPVEIPAGVRTLLGVRGRALLASVGHAASATEEILAGRNLFREKLGLPHSSGGPKNLAPAQVYADIVSAGGFGETSRLVEPIELAAAPSGWPEASRAAFAVLQRFQIGAGARLPVDRPLRSDEVAGIWAGLLARVGDFEENEGRLVSIEGTGILVKNAKGRTLYPLHPNRVLFQGGPDEFTPVRTLSLMPGDRVRVFSRDGRALAVAALSPPAAGLFERESSWIHWTRRFTGTELMSHLRERDPSKAGSRVTHLEVLARGRSGRAKEVRITSDRGNFLLKGLEIRFSLAIPELLFNVSGGQDATGEKIFTFFGRGWGHGIGLCQNGAFGMALAGRTYREILGHYYRGAQIGAAPPGIR